MKNKTTKSKEARQRLVAAMRHSQRKRNATFVKRWAKRTEYSERFIYRLLNGECQ